jgi:hypothetical protein
MLRNSKKFNSTSLHSINIYLCAPWIISMLDYLQDKCLMIHWGFMSTVHKLQPGAQFEHFECPTRGKRFTHTNTTCNVQMVFSVMCIYMSLYPSVVTLPKNRIRGPAGGSQVCRDRQRQRDRHGQRNRWNYRPSFLPSAVRQAFIITKHPPLSLTAVLP